MNNKSQLSVSHIFNSRLTSIISISLVLFLIGLTTLILLLTSELSVYVRENLTMSIVLKDEAKLVDIQKLQKNIDASVYAKSTEYIDKERAAKELAEELGQDPTEFLGYNPLLGSIELRLNSEYANNDSIAMIEAQLHKYPLVKEVIYQKDLIEIISARNTKKVIDDNATDILSLGIIGNNSPRGRFEINEEILLSSISTAKKQLKNIDNDFVAKALKGETLEYKALG